MQPYSIKIVPIGKPNADGTWHYASAPKGMSANAFWNWMPLAGYHIVAYRPHMPEEAPIEPEFIWTL